MVLNVMVLYQAQTKNTFCCLCYTYILCSVKRQTKTCSKYHTASTINFYGLQTVVRISDVRK